MFIESFVLAGAGSTQAFEDPANLIEPGVPAGLLKALAAMARVSTRQQAELGAAMLRSGLTLDDEQKDAALRHLFDTASIQEMIPLDDGGLIISVTSAGMERAAR